MRGKNSRQTLCDPNSEFEIRISFGFRISAFGFPLSPRRYLVALRNDLLFGRGSTLGEHSDAFEKVDCPVKLGIVQLKYLLPVFFLEALYSAGGSFELQGGLFLERNGNSDVGRDALFVNHFVAGRVVFGRGQ